MEPTSSTPNKPAQVENTAVKPPQEKLVSGGLDAKKQAPQTQKFGRQREKRS